MPPPPVLDATGIAEKERPRDKDRGLSVPPSADAAVRRIPGRFAHRPPLLPSPPSGLPARRCSSNSDQSRTYACVYENARTSDFVCYALAYRSVSVLEPNEMNETQKTKKQKTRIRLNPTRLIMPHNAREPVERVS